MNRLVMFFFVFLALLSFTVRSQCQTYIFGRADFPVGNNPTGVAAGDFNGDGLTDLVAANNGDDTISILLARPDGTFAPQVIYSTGPKPVSTVSTDLNGDGNLDLVVTNENCTAGPSGLSCSSPGTVSILLGNGDGTFQPHVDYVVGKLPSSVAIADVNGDGNPDLAVANTFDGTVSVLLGNGDGTFQPQMLYATAGQSSWRSVVVADFNGDGKLDLAVNCDSSVSVLLGNGDGTFQAHMDSSIGVTGGISLATGDFNHDGKPDLAVTTQVGGALVSVLLGVGDGTFLVQAQYAGGSFVAVNDLNGDGKLDLIETGAVNASSFFVAVRLGNGDGTFQSEVHYGTGNSPFGFMVVDLNGDGKLDLAIANAGCNIVGNACSGQQVPPGTISILLGLGDGTFVGKADYGTPGALAIATADFNKDSNLDLATANQLSDSVSLLLGNGNGTFQPETSYPVGHLPVWVASGDFRNNGDVDLVTANEICPGSSPCNPGTVSVLLGNGDGTFQPHTDYNVGLFPISVVVGSLRGNGTLDLAVVNRGSSSVSILLGNGDGTFQPQVSYLTAFSPEQVVIGDFNQDSKPDLAIALGGGVYLAWERRWHI